MNSNKGILISFPTDFLLVVLSVLHLLFQLFVTNLAAPVWAKRQSRLPFQMVHAKLAINQTGSYLGEGSSSNRSFTTLQRWERLEGVRIVRPWGMRDSHTEAPWMNSIVASQHQSSKPHWDNRIIRAWVSSWVIRVYNGASKSGHSGYTTLVLLGFSSAPNVPPLLKYQIGFGLVNCLDSLS